MQTIRLLKREQTTVTYLLAERGYSQDFMDTVLPLFGNVEAPELPVATPTAVV
jgi:hypothetical protein